MLMAAEANDEGAWQRLGSERFPANEPLVEGVDFPRLALSEARWADGRLVIRLAAQSTAVLGQPASFRVTGLSDPASWHVRGPANATADARSLHIATTIGDHTLTVERRA